MKKLTTLALALSMAIGLSACGNPHQSGSFPDPSAGVQWPTQTINVICRLPPEAGTDNTILLHSQIPGRSRSDKAWWSQTTMRPRLR